MSFGSCACPLPAALADVVIDDCNFSLHQIQKVIIARKGGIDITAANALILDTWTALLTAVDDTKIVVSPFIENFVIPQGEAILEGGDDNTTIDGNPIVVGAKAIRATGVFAELSPASMKSIKALNCETNLEMIFINQFGEMFGNGVLVGDAPGVSHLQGIPITSFFVGDPANEGLNTRDKGQVGFNLRYGWRDNLIKVVPTAFDPRFDIHE